MKNIAAQMVNFDREQMRRIANNMPEQYDEKPQVSPLWLSASSSACHGLLIITVITPLPTKSSAIRPHPQSLTCRSVNMM